ncbi:DUF2970 domain-containing protein [Neptuniibacter sp.]|uniref:DUF2970 domain-containing protein n=1 Tax=Neptuniibacter sp. TaxID=1962643 RepID=UPI00337A2C23|nr:DUF2970 domain-containing protein [Neptuniibacter sp.]
MKKAGSDHSTDWPQFFASALAAFLGVHSQSNYERDFRSGHFWPYILMGVLLLIFLVCFAYLLVNLSISYFSAAP